MIVVKIELHPKGNADRATTIGCMVIHNIGGTDRIGKYRVLLGRKGQTVRQILDSPLRQGVVESYARVSASVWVLITRALRSVQFGPVGDPADLEPEFTEEG